MNCNQKIIFSSILALSSLSPLLAADYTVLNTNSSGTGSFSEILAFANVTPDPTVNIYFLSAVFDASRKFIPAPATPFIVSRSIIFHGPPSGVVLQQTPSATERVLEIANTAVGQTTFTDVVFNKGKGGAGGQLKIDATSSAGTVNVTFNHCEFLSATSTGRGGSTVVTGGAVVSFNRCSFIDNVSYSNGGAVAVAGSTATFRTCLFKDNTTLDDGGGLFALNSTVGLFGCTLLDNIAGSHSHGQPASADDIGNGGGINSSGTSTVTLVNTLLSGNLDLADAPLLADDVRPDLSGSFISSGHNFVSKRDGSSGFGPTYIGTPPTGDQIGTNAAPLDPMLGYDDGPLWRSPVREAGSNSGASGFLLDLMGKPRIVGKKVDIGAREFQFDRTVTNAADSGPGSLREAMTGMGGSIAIDFDQTFFNTPRTITLLSQLPQIVGPRIIDASFTQGVTINGDSLYPIFHFKDATDGEYHALHSLHLKNGLKPIAGPIAGAAVDMPDDSDTLDMFDCTVSGCTGGLAIRSFAFSTLVNCTISGNNAGYATSVFFGRGDLIHCTVAGNSCASGGPFAEYPGNIILGNSIVSGNTVASGSPSLTGISSFGGNATDIAFTLPYASDFLGNARISASLARDGGLVPTRALLLDSPAIDNGIPELFAGYRSPANDANGRARVLGDLPDAGASEWASINYAAWKLLVFTTTPGSQQGPLRDPDDDGVPNAVEFFCGSDPLSFNKNPLVLQYEGGVTTLQYPKAPGRMFQSAQLMSCSNLVDWAPLQAFPNPSLFSSTGFADIFQTIGSPNYKKRFFRLEVNP